MAAFKKIAHRGASGNYPESTGLALAKAIGAGADMIELDCQLTQDGHVVIFHDDKLGRTAGGRGTLRDKTLAQLKKLDIGRWRGKAFAGERILTLEEGLEILGGKVDLCLEFKTFGAAAPSFDLKVLFTLSHFDYLDRTILSSFDYHCLARLRDHAPEAAIGIIYGAVEREDPLEAARRLGAVSIHVQKEMASRDFLRQAWDEGLDVYVWTVNEVREMRVFAELGVQGLISDFPEKLARL